MCAEYEHIPKSTVPLNSNTNPVKTLNSTHIAITLMTA